MTTYEYKIVNKTKRQTRYNTFWDHNLTDLNTEAADGWRLFKECKDCYLLEKIISL